MIRIVGWEENDGRIAQFVAEKIGSVFYPPFVSMGIERDGEIIAGVVFNHYERHDIHVTIAGHGWTKGFLNAVGDYLFRTMKVCRATAITASPEVVKLGVRLGGQVEGTLRSHFGHGKDATVIGVLRDEYRF